MRAVAEHGPAFRVRTKAPDSEDVAAALVLAAKMTGRGAMAALDATMRDRPAGAGVPSVPSLGAALFDWRWLALAALQEVWPGCLEDWAERWADEQGRSVGACKRAARRRSWWSAEKVELLALTLRARHGG